MKIGSKEIQSLCYGSRGIVKAMFGSKLIWEKFNAEEAINTILESIIDGNELNNMSSLLSQIESSNKDFSDINTQLEEIIQGGLATPNLITFTVDGVSYQAEEGMTWEEWVNSEYNVDEFWCDGNHCVRPVNTWRLAILNITSNIETPSFAICDGCVYHTADIGNSGGSND